MTVRSMRSAPPRRDSVGRRASLAIVGAPSAPAAPAFAAPAAPALDEATIARHTVAAREFYNARRRRHKHLPADLFGEPTWDILLDLYVAGRENRRVPTTSACIGAHVPPTTALRWLRILEARGMVEREDDGRDGRRTFVHLSPAGLAAMDATLALMCQRMDDIADKILAPTTAED